MRASKQTIVEFTIALIAGCLAAAAFISPTPNAIGLATTATYIYAGTTLLLMFRRGPNKDVRIVVSKAWYDIAMVFNLIALSVDPKYFIAALLLYWGHYIGISTCRKLV